MVVPHQPKNHRVGLARADEHGMALRRVRLHQGSLLLAQRARLAQHFIRNRPFADIMERGNLTDRASTIAFMRTSAERYRAILTELKSAGIGEGAAVGCTFPVCGKSNPAECGCSGIFHDGGTFKELSEIAANLRGRSDGR